MKTDVENEAALIPTRFLIASVVQTLKELQLFEVQRVELLQGKVIFTGEFLVSMVGFSGEMTGLLSLYCSRALALQLAERLVGTRQSRINAEVRDSLGELTNLMAGRLKKLLDARGTLFSLSLPTVIEGSNFTTSRFDTRENRLLQVDGPDGTIYIQLSVRK